MYIPIFIDSRGSGEADLAKLLKEMHLAVEVRHIDSGDIVFGDVGIERKTVQDLINSVMGQNKHFWEQLDVLKHTYKLPIVIVEGPFSYKDAWISGVLTSILFGWKIAYVTTFNMEETSLFIKRLFIKYGPSKTKAYPPAAVRKADTPEKIRWMMLQCIRGIGPKAATKIIKEINPFIYTEKFTDIILEERLKKVKGLNKRSKELLIQVFKG